MNGLRRFPAFELRREDQNPAIRLFGRRFYRDQTPIEYLAEFLLVFASPKIEERQHSLCFPELANPRTEIQYWPEDRLALKFFAFFASSKLDTRHSVHMKAYQEALDEVKAGIRPQQDKDRELAIRLLQSLFSGFVGVAKHRTWTTHTFFPASKYLLSREVGWRHTGVGGAKGKELQNWEASQQYFDTGSHNFMARGGELLYLQLLNLFTDFSNRQISEFLHDQSYTHLCVDGDLKYRLENTLSQMLQEIDRQLEGLVGFVESRLDEFRLSADIRPRPATLGWVPKDTLSEALLFAWEMLNICSSSQSPLQKVALLETLCCMHVLRSLCFQARRLGGDAGCTPHFAGNYAWVVCAPDASQENESRKIALRSYESIERMLYRVLREPSAYERYDASHTHSIPAEDAIAHADDHVFKLFRKLGKEIGLVVPPSGPSMRLTLPSYLVRFLVAALIKPGTRVRLDEFYRRIFAHYGIAISSRALSEALSWLGDSMDTLGISQDSMWFEEELQRGGLLIALSDAVSMVENPYRSLQEQTT